ncbi:MAG: MaoC/PaaZ C-terminal domain-containing protein [Thermoleophilia bacterium]|nr:MaoC/PaaZ C-terminal domain-containing protein [Thermoleophilia bacterium]
MTDFYEEVGRSGRLSFLVTELEGRDLDGGLAVRGREITVVGREIRGTGGDRDMIAKTLGLGEAIPSLVKDPIDKAQLLRYAGGSGDYALVHTDVETARAAGLGDVIAHGMLSMGFLGQLVVRWAGAENIRRIQTRFAVIVRLGEVLTCRGVVRSVTPIEDGRRSLVTLEIWAENQKGETVTYGEAEVYSDLER